jgi:hypothetical protein
MAKLLRREIGVKIERQVIKCVARLFTTVALWVRICLFYCRKIGGPNRGNIYKSFTET